MNGRRIYHARGKVLGGSSWINGMIFQRGNPLDYERWAADPGMGSWDYAHCLPYFKRMETCLAGGDEFRGTDGPLVLERGPGDQPAVRRVLRRRAAGRATPHRRRQRLPPGGLRPFDRNISRGRRLRAARAYLHPVMGRPNLNVECRAFVTRILFEGGRAVGVEFSPGRGAGGGGGGVGGGAQRSGRCGRGAVGRAGCADDAAGRAGEVILCGGAINSPQLLQLSGVGAPPTARRARHQAGRRPARRRREPAGPPRGLRPVRLQAAGLGGARAEVAQPADGRRSVAVPAQRARARPTTSRPAASSAATTRSPTRT